jgi:branched-chain amino acid transport system substrate-binding protein
MNSRDFVSLDRRSLIKAGGAAGVAGMAPVRAWGATERSVKIGMIDPKTGPYADDGSNEVVGARFAVAQINKAGGILGRPVELILEDSEGLPGPGMQKAQRLVHRNQVDFLMGSVSSAVSQSVGAFAEKQNKLFVVTGGHVDAVTGSECAWTTFRTCTTTWMLSAGDFEYLFKRFGKRWYFITPDYSYGHAVFANYATLLKQAGGTMAGNALVPLGTTDFSSYLVGARGAKPDVLMCLNAGTDLINLLKQIVQFGLDRQLAIGGAQQELETLQALPKAALLGWWSFEWYWKQPDVPAVAPFVAAYRAFANGTYPTARSWFGFASAHSIALAANRAKSLDTIKVVRALEGLELPPDIALQPGSCMYRAGDHQMIANVFPGHVIKNSTYPNMFDVAKVVSGASIAKSPADSGCRMTYPS